MHLVVEASHDDEGEHVADGGQRQQHGRRVDDDAVRHVQRRHVVVVVVVVHAVDVIHVGRVAVVA